MFSATVLFQYSGNFTGNPAHTFIHLPRRNLVQKLHNLIAKSVA